MKAVDVMATDVIIAWPQDTVQKLAVLLLEHRISAVPVVDEDGMLVGIVSEGDLMRRAEIGTERRRPWWLECSLCRRRGRASSSKQMGPG